MRDYLLDLALLLLFCLSGCGREDRITGFENYVAAFEKVSQSLGSKQSVSPIVIEFDTTQKVAVGQCEMGDLFSSPHIRINETRWGKMNETQHQVLLFHELGHCVLKRLHDSELRPDGTPKSIMYPYLLSARTFAQSRDYYLNELFGASH